jgi:asparagine N-glycosylation enzyme membrane subunit Stt3
MYKKELKSLSILLFIYFFLRLIFFDTSYFFGDEAAYVMTAFALTGKNYYNEINFRPPLLPFFLSFILYFTQSEIAIKLFPIFFNSLSIFAVYFLGREINQRIGFLSALLLAIFPFHIQASRWVMTDSVNLIFFSLTLLFFYKTFSTYGKNNKNSCFYPILTGFFLALSILTKFTSFFLFFIILPFILLNKKIFKKVIISLIVFFLTILPYLIFCYSTFNNLFYPIIFSSKTLFYKPPVKISYVVWTFLDFFGFLILFFGFGIYYILKDKNEYQLFIFYCWCMSILMFIILLGGNITRIGWEVERFYFPALPFFLVISSLAIIKLNKNYMLLSIFLLILFNIPLYIRAYTSAINFEDWRRVNKEMGIYIKNNTKSGSLIFCNFDCAPLAFYSMRTVKYFEWNENVWEKLPQEFYLTINPDFPPNISEILKNNLIEIKTISSNNSTIILFFKPSL